jgi:hypothetical protein
MSAAGSVALAAEVRPRPVYSVIEHLHRDRAAADEACRGRFTELGQTIELGAEPDWHDGGFPADEEWRIAFGKFYVGLELAAAFAQTGRPLYQRTWERLVSSWIDQVAIGSESTDTVARRLLNWIYAWNGFVRAPAFTGMRPGWDDVLVRSIAAQVTWLREHLTAARNHRTLELYALFIVALALPEVDPDGALAQVALTELERNLASDFRPDGVHVEASTHYHLIVLRSFVGVRENAPRFGLKLSAQFDERLERALDFAMHVHRPDGEIPALSDSDAGGYGELLVLAGDLMGRADYRYVGTGGASGEPPRDRNVSFPDGGYHVQRSGWGRPGAGFADERFLIFDCGPLGDGGHGHYDLLSVELAGAGAPLVVDPGRYTYHEGTPNLRRWFKGTAAHNTVCVDRCDQTEYRPGKPKTPAARGHFLGRLRAPGLDVLWGAATSDRYDARHERRVLFVAGEYWVFEDALTACRPHRYEQRWHLTPRAHRSVAVRIGARDVTAVAPGLALVFTPDVELTVEEGWFAPRYGIRYPAPVLSAVRDGLPGATMITIAVPLAPRTSPPCLRTVERDAGRTTVVIDGGAPGAQDTVCWNAEGSVASWRRVTR